MSIVYFKIRYAAIAGEAGNLGLRTRTLQAVAKADSAADDVDTVYAAGPFAVGSPYSHSAVFDPLCVCQKVTIRQDEKHERVWRISYEFSTCQRDPGPNPEEPDPLKRLPRYNTRKEKRQVVLWVDKSQDHQDPDTGQWVGKPIINSATGRFSVPTMADRSRLIVTVVRNEVYFDIPLAVEYFDTTNEDRFWGQDPGIVKCDAITGAKVWERYGAGVLGYWEVTYELHFDRDGWHEKRLDEGAFALKTIPDPSSGTGATKLGLALPIDANGVPFTGPVLLDGQGGQLSPEAIAAGNVVYLDFVTLDPRPFAPLRLPYPT